MTFSKQERIDEGSHDRQVPSKQRSFAALKMTAEVFGHVSRLLQPVWAQDPYLSPAWFLRAQGSLAEVAPRATCYLAGLESGYSERRVTTWRI